MTTPMTITSLSQGVLRKPTQSDEAYWDQHADQPLHEDLSFWHAMKIEWPRWLLRRRADRA